MSHGVVHKFNSILMPRMQQGIEGGFGAPPEETTFEIVNEVRT